MVWRVEPCLRTVCSFVGVHKYTLSISSRYMARVRGVCCFVSLLSESACVKMPKRKPFVNKFDPISTQIGLLCEAAQSSFLEHDLVSAADAVSLAIKKLKHSSAVYAPVRFLSS